jgi:hypothetical protein
MIRALTLLAVLSASACVVVPGGRYRTTGSSLKKADGCDPNQYWDGTMCRHKGKGHGARKHDG